MPVVSKVISRSAVPESVARVLPLVEAHVFDVPVAENDITPVHVHCRVGIVVRLYVIAGTSIRIRDPVAGIIPIPTGKRPAVRRDAIR